MKIIFKTQMFLSGFGIFFDKMAAIDLDFKGSGFWISDPIQNLDHLLTHLFSIIENGDASGFQIPTVVNLSAKEV